MRRPPPEVLTLVPFGNIDFSLQHQGVALELRELVYNRPTHFPQPSAQYVTAEQAQCVLDGWQQTIAAINAKSTETQQWAYTINSKLEEVIAQCRNSFLQCEALFQVADRNEGVLFRETTQQFQLAQNLTQKYMAIEHKLQIIMHELDLQKQSMNENFSEWRSSILPDCKQGVERLSKWGILDKIQKDLSDVRQRTTTLETGFLFFFF